MRRSAVLVLALVPGVAAAGDPLAFFADGLGKADFSSVVEVPLLRGVDTGGLPAVLASGTGEDPEEFLLTLDLTSGPSKCTEAVVGALGGWVQDKVVARSGSLFGKTIKTETKAGFIPELHIGDAVLRDLHCEVDKSVNALSVTAMPELAVALLPSKGVVKLAPAAQAAELLASVGTPMAVERGEPGVTWYQDKKVAALGVRFVVTGELFGQPARLALAPHEDTYVASSFSGIPFQSVRAGKLWTAGAASVGGVALPVANYVVYDGDISFPLNVDAVLGSDVLYALDIAVDPAGGQIAVAAAKTVTWQDPSEKLLADAKKAFDKAGGDESSALLAPFVAPDSRLALWTPPVQERCTVQEVTESSLVGTRDGVRALGASTTVIKEIPCPPVRRERAEPEPDGDAGAFGPEASGDKKEAERQANWGDALWKHGRYDDAFAVYEAAAAQAPDDCSYHLEVARTGLMVGQTDKALVAAGRSAELYEAWRDLSLADRLAVQNKSADAPSATPQADDCHQARGLEATALLVRGSDSKVEAIYDKYMDLDESLAMAVSLSRMRKGLDDKAHGSLLQAVNVGGRGRQQVHLALATLGARTERPLLADANVDRLFMIQEAWGLYPALGAYEVSYTLHGADGAKAFVDRLAKEHPSSAVAWTLVGLDALHRGDQATLATVKAEGPAIAQMGIDRAAGDMASTCQAGALFAVMGDAARARNHIEQGTGRGDHSTSCQAAELVTAAVSGDAQAVASAPIAVMEPAVTLGLVRAITKAAAPE